MRFCDCDDWAPQIDKIDSYILFCHNQIAAPKYNPKKDKIFNFCPWCGEKLKEENVEEIPRSLP